MTKDVSEDLGISATSSITAGDSLSQISDILTLSLSLKLLPDFALATSNRSLNKNKWRSWQCTPCTHILKENNRLIYVLISSSTSLLFNIIIIYIDELNGSFHYELSRALVSDFVRGRWRRFRSQRFRRQSSSQSGRAGSSSFPNQPFHLLNGIKKKISIINLSEKKKQSQTRSVKRILFVYSTTTYLRTKERKKKHLRIWSGYFIGI